MTTFGFVIDNRKCIGCHACTVACKSEHEVPLGVDRTWVKYIEKGTFPNNRRLFTVMRCNHCDRAPCVTICPVTALYRRDDGVIDFNNERCIGCKACMQACPYDALYIDPDSQTAAKCNFCTHRLEAGLEPSCVVVCPEQAIIAGDLDDPHSVIAQLVDRHPVSVRKPEKGTHPKLFYIDGDEAALVPSRTSVQDQYLWSGSWSSTDTADRTEPPSSGPVSAPAQVRRVYDVRRRPASWGMPVAAYTWTKSLASGSMLAAAAIQLWGLTVAQNSVLVGLGVAGLLMLAITSALLVYDLKQPKRFLYVLLRPQWRSWLVRGAYILTAYGVVLAAWTLFVMTDFPDVARWLLVPGVLLAVPAAVYTAFLFAQAKGRDLWQSPLLSFHLLVHALLAGSACWLLLVGWFNGDAVVARWFTVVSISLSALILLAEILTTHPTDDARAAMQMIVKGIWSRWFWLVGMLVGHGIPLLLLSFAATWADAPAAVMALVGMFVIETLWVLAPQRIPLS